MIGLQFNIGPSRQAIAEALTALTNPQPMYADIGEYMVDSTRQRFVSGEAPDGSSWAPKSEATLERYRRLGYGTLSRPLFGPGRRLSREILNFVSKDGVVIGSSLIYSRVMNEGAAKGEFGHDSQGNPIPWGRIPARQWLGISTADATAIVEIADEHLAGALGQVD